MKFYIKYVTLSVILLAITSSPAFAQGWQTPQRLSEAGIDAKSARLAGAADGGFHAIYSADQLVYRRWQNGVLGPRVAITGGQFNPHIAEAGNGDIHVAWESWWEGDNIPVGWARSINGGQTWSRTTISNPGTKYPFLAHYGPGNSSTMMLVSGSFSGGNDTLRWATFNGTSWSGMQYLTHIESVYGIEGITRSLADGSVWKIYQGTDARLYIRRFNGSVWETPIHTPDPPTFRARLSIAVNSTGQVAVYWSQDHRQRVRIYTPGSGWSDMHIFGTHPDHDRADVGRVTAIPGTNDFYFSYERGGYARGVRWSNGVYLDEEIVSAAHSNQFVPDTFVTAGSDGSLYYAWESWMDGGPRQYYSVKPGLGSASGTLQGYVRNQHGIGVPSALVASGAFITATGTDGSYTLQIPEGTVSVTASKIHYASHTVDNIVISDGQTTNQDFTITTNPPAAVSNFSAYPSNSTTNRLQWTNPSSANFAATRVVFKTTGYPSSPDDGILVGEKSGAPGSSDSLVHSGLTAGVTYYYTAFTRDVDHNYSSGVNSSSTPHHLSCGDAKTTADGHFVNLNNKVVSAIFIGDASIYVQEPDRSSGIRVLNNGSGLAVGDRVNISGTVATRVLSSHPAERQISSASVTKVSSGEAPRPLNMTTLTVGGAAIPPFIPGVIDGVGLNNMGLLVRTTGRVTFKISSFIHIDDGNDITDPTGRKGIMIRCPSTSISVDVGDVVSVTGIVEGSVPIGETENRRLIRLRNWNDLQLH